MSGSIEVGVIKNPGTTIDEEKSQMIEFQQKDDGQRRMEIQKRPKEPRNALEKFCNLLFKFLGWNHVMVVQIIAHIID